MASLLATIALEVTKLAFDTLLTEVLGLATELFTETAAIAEGEFEAVRQLSEAALYEIPHLKRDVKIGVTIAQAAKRAFAPSKTQEAEDEPPAKIQKR